MLYPKIPLSLHRFSTKSHRVKRLKGEMVEWSITAVLKTAVLRGTGGSNPSLSANKGVNQQVTRFAPFITPENVRLGVFYLDSHKHSFNCKKEWWTIFLLCASPLITALSYPLSSNSQRLHQTNGSFSTHTQLFLLLEIYIY